MKSPRLWGYLYLFMGSTFVLFAIQQKNNTNEWDFFTIALIAIAAYDYMISIRYLTFNSKKRNKKD